MSENLKYWKILALHIVERKFVLSKSINRSINGKDYILLSKTIRERDNNNNRKINDHSIRREVSIFATVIFEQYAERDWYNLTYL